MLNSQKIGNSFSFPLKGENSLFKIFIAGLLSTTGLGNFVFHGYGFQIMRDVLEKPHEEQDLPDWDMIWENFIESLRYLLVNIIWNIPLIIINFILTLIIILISVAINEDNAGITVTMLVLVIFISCGFNTLYKIFKSGLTPTINGELATKQTIQAGLNLKHILTLTKGFYWQNIGINIISSFYSFILFIAGTMMLYIGFYFTTPIGIATKYHLWGQSYKQMLAKN